MQCKLVVNSEHSVPRNSEKAISIKHSSRDQLTMTLNPHVHENLKAIQRALSNYDMSFLGDDEEDFCPLCLEPMDITDKNFKPCPCGYQICQFCYNNIRQNEELNGRCPACRRKYDDDSVEYVVLTAEELRMEREKQTRKEWERRQREKERKESEYANRRHLAGMRVIQKNLVYVVGVNPPVPYEEVAGILKSDKYFGQYGKISKIVVNRKTPAGSNNDHYHSNNNSSNTSNAGNNSSGSSGIVPGYGVYITFFKKEDAARCIAQVDGTYMDGRLVKAAYGTTKYCSSYLRGLSCPNPNCMFLHEPGEEADSFNRKELSNKPSTQRNTQGNGPIYRSGGGHFSGTSSPAAVKVQLHHDYHNNGNSTPILTPAPVPTGSNPWGVSNNTSQLNSNSLSKNGSAHNLPTLGETLGQQQQQQQQQQHGNNNENSSSHSKKKQQDKSNGKDYADPYDALGSAVAFLDQRIDWFSNYKSHEFNLQTNLVDDETYSKYPSLFSWENLETSEQTDQTLTRKLVDILAINPVDYSASVISFLQNASASTNLTSNASNTPVAAAAAAAAAANSTPAATTTPLPQQIQLHQQAPPPAAMVAAAATGGPQHQQHPLNVNTPPPPGIFTPQQVALHQQQQQHQQQPMAAETASTPNSADFLNQLIHGRKVAAGN